MNKFALVAALSLVAAAGTVFADDITPDNTAKALSLKSRDQVQAELFKARADGSIKVWSTSYNPLLLAKSEKSRAEVRGEVLADPDGSLAQAVIGEDSGSFALSRIQPARASTSLHVSVGKTAK